MATLEVRKDDLSRTRVLEQETPASKEGEVRAKIDRFALTANNITYGVVGDKIGYWKFFPAAEGWGVIPVWGFADVVSTKHPDVKAGERLYGYFPMGTHLVMAPANVRPERLADGASIAPACRPSTIPMRVPKRKRITIRKWMTSGCSYSRSMRRPFASMTFSSTTNGSAQSAF